MAAAIPFSRQRACSSLTARSEDSITGRVRRPWSTAFASWAVIIGGSYELDRLRAGLSCTARLLPQLLLLLPAAASTADLDELIEGLPA
jgi:hypothetical protein